MLLRLQVRRLEAEKKELKFELERLRKITNNGETPVDVVSCSFYLKLIWNFLHEISAFNILIGFQSTEKHPAGNYIFKVNSRNTRTRFEICSKLTTKTPERDQWHRSSVCIVNFEHTSYLVIVFLLLTLSR